MEYSATSQARAIRSRPSVELGTDAVPARAAVDDTVETRTTRHVANQFQIESAEGGDVHFTWAVAETQGRRPDMEDAHAVALDIDGHGTALFGIFDGHAGKEVSTFCAQHVASELAADPSFRAGDVGAGLAATFMRLDQQLADPANKQMLYAYRKGLAPEGPPGQEPPMDAGMLEHASEDGREKFMKKALKYGRFDEAGRYFGPKAGSTAAVAVVHDHKLHVASAGDSRVVLCVHGRAVVLTHDHKPDLPEEAERIERAGLFVASKPGNVPRVAGSLAMSRAMGDVKYKTNAALPAEQQAVTAAPDVMQRTLSVRSAPFLLLACDGLWDVMSHQEAMDCVLHSLADGASLRKAAQELVIRALTGAKLESCSGDNITAMIVAFH